MGLHGYIDDQLEAESNEKILYRAHVSWIPIIIRFIPFVLVGVVIAGILIGINSSWSAIAGGIFCALLLMGIIFNLPRAIHNLGVDIVITNKAVHSKTGLIAIKDDRQTTLDRVDDIDIDFTSVFKRLFDYGDIEMRTIGESGFAFKDIAHPRALKKAINAAKAEYLGENPHLHAAAGAVPRTNMQPNSASAQPQQFVNPMPMMTPEQYAQWYNQQMSQQQPQIPAEPNSAASMPEKKSEE